MALCCIRAVSPRVYCVLYPRGEPTCLLLEYLLSELPYLLVNLQNVNKGQDHCPVVTKTNHFGSQTVHHIPRVLAIPQHWRRWFSASVVLV